MVVLFNSPIRLVWPSSIQYGSLSTLGTQHTISYEPSLDIEPESKIRSISVTSIMVSDEFLSVVRSSHENMIKMGNSPLLLNKIIKISTIIYTGILQGVCHHTDLMYNLYACCTSSLDTCCALLEFCFAFRYNEHFEMIMKDWLYKFLFHGWINVLCRIFFIFSVIL